MCEYIYVYFEIHFRIVGWMKWKSLYKIENANNVQKMKIEKKNDQKSNIQKSMFSSYSKWAKIYK